MKPRNLNILGIIVSLITIIGVLIWAKLAGFSDLPLNQQGEFIAGIVAFLAFLWLILGFQQQGYQIKENSKALEKQQNELSQQVRALQGQESSLDDAAKSLREYNRPYITSHIELKGSKEIIYFIVQNIGIRPAYNVEFAFDPSLKEFAQYEKMNYDKFINLDFIPPGYKKEYILSNRPRELSDKKDIDWKVMVKITYSDGYDRDFIEEYTMSFFDAFNKIYDNTPSVEESLKRINELLKENMNKKVVQDSESSGRVHD